MLKCCYIDTAEDEDDPQKYDFGVYDDGEPGDYPEPQMPSEPPQTHVNITDILDRPPSDPEGDDSDGGSDDEEEAVDEVGADTDDASDNETDMVVLDPDHVSVDRNSCSCTFQQLIVYICSQLVMFYQLDMYMLTAVHVRFGP